MMVGMDQGISFVGNKSSLIIGTFKEIQKHFHIAIIGNNIHDE